MRAGSEVGGFEDVEEFGWIGKKFVGKADWRARGVVFAVGPGRRTGVEAEIGACGKERLELARATWNPAIDGTAAVRWAPLDLEQKLEQEVPTTFLQTCGMTRLYLLRPAD